MGSGLQIRAGYINVDKFYTEEQLRSKKGFFKQADIQKGGTFVQADILHLPFEDNYADHVELSNCIEHFPLNNVINYVKEIHRVMKPGAKLYIMTNSMDGLALDWLDLLAHPPFNPQTYNDVAETIYGNQQAEGEVHRCPFTPPFMDYVLTQAGFKSGTISIAKKNTLISVIPKVFTSAGPIRKNAVCRNDLLFVEATK